MSKKNKRELKEYVRFLLSNSVGTDKYVRRIEKNVESR
jgi:hypothetical protein